jgi:hypothetical protein
LRTTLYVHLIAALIFAFGSSTLHRLFAPQFDPLLRAGVMAGIIIALDALVVAPLFERSFAMFRSVIGTWLPFAGRNDGTRNRAACAAKRCTRSLT